MNIGETLKGLVMDSGFAALTWQQVIMILVSCVLLYLAIVKKFEPLLLVTIAFGMLLANLPLGGVMSPPPEGGSFTEAGILYIFSQGVKSSVFPCLIFLGVGAMTDFGPMLANPSSLLLGGAAQLGIYVAFVLAIAMGYVSPGIAFTPQQAAAIAIIGGADGPTAIFLASKLASELLAPIAVAAYSYMALIPLIQPPIMRLLTTEEERKIKMTQQRKVSQTEKIVFPIVVTILVVLALPSVAPLIGMLMLGNLFRECGVVERLSDTAQNALINIITILLGVSVGASAEGELFLKPQTLMIIVLGLTAFAFSTAGGVLLGKLMCKLTHGRINPLIGAAGVSAVPMAARVANVEGQKYNKSNYLLMFAMGPNVAGVIGSAVAAGFLLKMFGG